MAHGCPHTTVSRLAPISYTDVWTVNGRARVAVGCRARPRAVRACDAHAFDSADSGQHTYIVVLTYLGIYERRTLVINYQNNHGICCISAGVHAAHSAPDAATSMITRQTHDPLWL